MIVGSQQDDRLLLYLKKWYSATERGDKNSDGTSTDNASSTTVSEVHRRLLIVPTNDFSIDF